MVSALSEGGTFQIGLTNRAMRFSESRSGPTFKIRFETTEEVWRLFQESDIWGLTFRAILGRDGEMPFFSLDLANPSPSATKTKGEPSYRITFEVLRDAWLWALDNMAPDDVWAGELKVETHQPQREPDTQDSEESPNVASILHRHGFFRNPHVWGALGTDVDYQEWCRSQPCLVCNDGDYDGVRLSNEYAHVRDASNSGVAYKPQFSGLPMCRTHHRLQHDQGYEVLRQVYNSFRSRPSRDGSALEWLFGKARNYLERWAHERFREELNVDSLSEASAEDVRYWAQDNDLYWALPKPIKEEEPVI